ncbi:MAG: hypothetical protein OXH20_07020 [bacterium]|nr:hypothetical protein [bacterium]MDE0669634.1 hypothetical protein [bacterium]MXZ31524.1 hypothetical protein [Acidimicrobiia bacterium]MYB24951.1 hypothetical protein [Acidimicrobiia bacterium]
MTVLIIVLVAVGGLVALLVGVVLMAAGQIAGRLARARPPEAAEAERMEVYVEALCLGAGLPVPRLAVIDDAACGALAYGRGPRAATLAVTTGLLEDLAAVELEGALAHLLARVADGTTGRHTRLFALGLLGGPLGASWAARRLDAARVVAADIAAARLTRFPPGLVGALARMEQSAPALAARSPAIRHLWMHEALGPGRQRVPVADRITVLSDL